MLATMKKGTSSLRSEVKKCPNNSILYHKRAIIKLVMPFKKANLLVLKSNPHVSSKLEIVEFYGWYQWFPISM